MTKQLTVSARVRAFVATHGRATLAQIRVEVPEANPQTIYALAGARHIVRIDDARPAVYGPGRAPRPYGVTPEQRQATRDAKNARVRDRYAAERGGKVRPRRRPGSNPPAPKARKPAPPPSQPAAPRAASAATPAKPSYWQHVQLSNSYGSPFSPPPQRKRQGMTSHEWEAQGGTVERLAPGAVSSHSALRFDHS